MTEAFEIFNAIYLFCLYICVWKSHLLSKTKMNFHTHPLFVQLQFYLWRVHINNVQQQTKTTRLPMVSNLWIFLCAYLQILNLFYINQLLNHFFLFCIKIFYRSRSPRRTRSRSRSFSRDRRSRSDSRDRH